MNKVFTFLIFLFTTSLFAQDDINQLIIGNGGQFGNPNERSNVAAYDPIADTYFVFDTLPSNSLQQLLIEGDFLYVAAQSVIAKYDLDTYERLAIVDFPGQSAHELLIYEDKLFATNFYGQTENNLYVFDKNDLSIIDTIEEITASSGTMAVVQDRLFISQNLKGNTDGCAPFGCFNDTLGYLAEVNPATNQWIQNIQLNNNGTEIGRIIADDDNIFSLNSPSNTVTTFNVTAGTSNSVDVNGTVDVDLYRNEIQLVSGIIVSKFNDGIGVLSADLQTVTTLIDTFTTSFVYDITNDNFYITATDFFSFTRGMIFNGDGSFETSFPTGFAPEGIAIHYNRAPLGSDTTFVTIDDIAIIDLNDVAFDEDGDSLVVGEIQMAPLNGVVNTLANGNIEYRSLSPGTADEFRVEICDDKLNALCNFVTIRISGATNTALNQTVFAKTRIYPNPAKTQLFIDRPVVGSQYELFNMQGVLLKVFSSENTLIIDDLSSGNYLLRMTNGSSAKTFKFHKF